MGGLDVIGVTTAEPFPKVEADIWERKATNKSGSLGFTFSDPTTAANPRASFPWAESLIVGGRSYLPAGGRATAHPGEGRVARVAVEDSYTPLRYALRRVADLLEAEGFQAEVLVDDNRLVDRAAAVRAGLGWWGKNTMVLTPGYGPWLLFGSVITDASLPNDAPGRRDCGSCSACLPACPTGALIAPGILDARLCLAAWAQTSGVVPEPIRDAMGNRLYGCDDCLEACPPGHRLLARATRVRGTVDLREVLTAADSVLLERFGHWFIPDRDADIIRRNALIAAGNSGESSLAAIVATYTAHPDPVLAEHASWALAKIGGPVAQAVAANA